VSDRTTSTAPVACASPATWPSTRAPTTSCSPKPVHRSAASAGACIDHTSLPQSAAQCGGGLYPRNMLRVSTFVQGTATFLPFPTAIARDATCQCWAVATVIGDPAVVWLRDNGTAIVGRSIPGESIANIGAPGGYNPYGLAIAPDGTVYLADIHIQCTSPLVNCGPANHGGQELRASPTALSKPVVIAAGYDFPTSVTICVPSETVCPDPAASRG
jgi:hypothetical protein